MKKLLSMLLVVSMSGMMVINVCATPIPDKNIDNTETAVLAAETVHNDFSQSFPAAESERRVTRAEFSHSMATVLDNKGITIDYEGETAFSDTMDSHNYFQDVLLLKKLAIVSGDGDGAFRPNEAITYQEAAAMVGRVFATDATITEKYGAYPTGYIKYALSMGLFENVTAIVDESMNGKDLDTIMTNLENGIKVYDRMERLGCDAYNGEVYIDYYPKNWQGFEENPGVSGNGYFRILPAKLLYSYDNVNWNTLYEDVNGERVYYNLPENMDIDGARYAWEYGCFVNAPFDKEKKYYSYDNKVWQEGMPVANDPENVPLEAERYVLGIKKESIVYHAESGLYFSWQPYENKAYFSERYGTILQEIKYNMIWVSQDAETWIGITIPDNMMFFTSAGLNSKAEAIIIDGAVEFTRDEQAFLDEEEKIAAELGLAYDKPWYKTEKYILRFSDLKKLLGKHR